MWFSGATVCFYFSLEIFGPCIRSRGFMCVCQNEFGSNNIHMKESSFSGILYKEMVCAAFDLLQRKSGNFIPLSFQLLRATLIGHFMQVAFD